ncbi:MULTISPECIES: hypothetical protein [Luteimonas]|uniref:hypothetical protein n=1 Tax=Luteimonas TaxID=83614 RepID=UPI000C7DEEBF|nr:MULTISPECIES: hypothetical protein [Luteimonas]
MTDFDTLRIVIAEILAAPHGHRWTLQGFGMLRLHMGCDMRLHARSPDHAVPNVSTIHDHLQWGLTSLVICGNVENRIFREWHDGAMDSRRMHGVVLKPGVGTAFKSERFDTSLKLASRREYTAGERYSQEPSVIHESVPMPGTVTLMQKRPTQDESARVFWPHGQDWVSAEPRAATADEISAITKQALEVLAGELSYPDPSRALNHA